MSVIVRLSMSESSRQAIAARQNWGEALAPALSSALKQGLEETGAHLQNTYLRGGRPSSARNGRTPLAVRSGALLGSIATDVDQPPYSGYVGTRSGPASKYARMLLDSGTTTIRPKNAKHLWIPIAGNLNASGVMRMSPRAVMSMTDAKGKRRAKIFVSKNGNRVVFLPDANGGAYSKGKNKGRQRGQLMFVLKDQVEVKGTDALAKAAQDKTDRVGELLGKAIHNVISAPGSPGSPGSTGGTL